MTSDSPVAPATDPPVGGGAAVLVVLAVMAALYVATGDMPSWARWFATGLLVVDAGIEVLVRRHPLWRWSVRVVAATAVLVLCVMTSTGTPDRWVILAIGVLLVTGMAPGGLVRPLTPVLVAVALAGALTATGRASWSATVGGALLVLVGGWYANRQSALLEQAVDDAAQVRVRAGASQVLLAEQLRLVSLDVDETVSAVADSMVELGFRIVNVAELRDDHLVPMVTRGVGPEESLARMHVSEGIGGRCVREDRLIATADYRGSEDAYASAPAGVRSAVAAPLHVEGRIVGALTGASPEAAEWSDGDLQVITALAQQTSRALSVAQRRRQQQTLVQRLAELDTLKTDFLLSVSTDLRAPLTHVRGLSHTLHERLDQLDGASRTLLLDRLLENADRLHEMIVRLLDFNQLSARPGEPRPVVALAEVAAEAVDVLGPVDHARVLVDTDGLGRVVGDGLLLGRVMQELVSNACDHAPLDGPVHVTVVDDDEEVVVTVRNDGAGLPADVVRALRGTGDIATLGHGLRMVSRSLGLHGSHLEVHPGPGCVVAFRLPSWSTSALRVPTVTA